MIKTREAALRWAKSVIAPYYRQRPKESIWEWAERVLMIPPEENPDMPNAPYSTSYSPYVRWLMEWFREAGQKELFICKSSQVGITMAVLIVICWHIVHQPVNIGYCIDSKEEAERISRVRLRNWITRNKLLPNLGKRGDGLNNTTYYLPGMTVYMMGAYARGAFRNKSLEIGILDELDAHPDVGDKGGEGKSVDNMRGRLKRPKNSKLLAFSTPTLETAQMWQEYQSGDQHRIFVCCPHCGHEQYLEWEQVRFRGEGCVDLAGEVIISEVLEKTYYECASEKKCKIQQREKFGMLQKISIRSTSTSDKPNKSSLHISDLYSAHVTWGQLAAEYLEAEKTSDKMRAFYQQRLGLPFKEEEGQLLANDVLRLRWKGYKKGQCPLPSPALLGMAIDVQGDCMKWVKVAFDRAGTMYVLDYGVAVAWEVLREEVMQVVTLPCGNTLDIDFVLIDEGDGNRVFEVRRFAREFDFVWPVKGRGESQMGKTIQTSEYEFDGEMMLTYHIKDPAYKYELLYKRIGEAKARRLKGEPHVVLPRDVDSAFVDELLHERLVKKVNKYKFVENKWIKSGVNDYMDCLKYALVIWDLVHPVLKARGMLDDLPLPLIYNEAEQNYGEEIFELPMA